jgi:hypothetical protein
MLCNNANKTFKNYDASGNYCEEVLKSLRFLNGRGVEFLVSWGAYGLRAALLLHIKTNFNVSLVPGSVTWMCVKDA